jgi:hypothetical protein
MGTAIDEASADGTVADYNIYYGTNPFSTYMNVWDANGLFGVDPQLTDPDNGDFTLQSGSPAIGFADSALVAYLVTNDINDSTRTWTGEVSDAGAYLYIAEGEITAPDAPSDFTQTGSTTTTASFSITDNSTDESGFRVRDALSDSLITTITADQDTFTVTGLPPEFSAWWKVSAWNSGGETAQVDSINVTTEAQVVTSIVVSPSTASSPVGNPTTFAATVYDQYGVIMSEETVTFTATSGTIGESTGIHSCDVTGLITITATSVTDSEVTGTATLTVYQSGDTSWNGSGAWNGGTNWNGTTLMPWD